MTYEFGELNHETLLGPIAAAEDALARLDERVARSEVGSGFAARADFFESVSSMWIGGELVHLGKEVVGQLFDPVLVRQKDIL